MHQLQTIIEHIELDQTEGHTFVIRYNNSDMNDDRGGGGSLGAVSASNTTQSGSASWSSRPARPRPSLGIPSNSGGQAFNFSSGIKFTSRYIILDYVLCKPCLVLVVMIFLTFLKELEAAAVVEETTMGFLHLVSTLAGALREKHRLFLL